MDDREITTALERFISFRTIAGNAVEKQQCLDWISHEFLVDGHQSVEGGNCANCPYLFVLHPDAQWLWFAHVDVVPGRDAQFSLCCYGDRLVGRGVKDMKGAALPFLLAYREACRTQKIPRVSILLSTDEETGGKTIPTLLQKGLTAPIAFTPDTGSSPGIVTEHKGSAWLKLTCTGVSGHGAIPWESRNPILPLSESLQAIAKAFPPGTSGDWQMTVSATELTGSDAQNRIPQCASAILDVRYPSDQCSGSADVLQRLSPCLADACTLTLKQEGNPLKTDPHHPFIQRFLYSVEKVEGVAPPFIREHGSTDARHFCAAGIPAFLYGPIGGGIHGDEEWVSLQSLKKQYAIYQDIFARQMETW
jgi:acetylornithine deacetylase/succinyl-diaminopimelate desuccinylase-like protein